MVYFLIFVLGHLVEIIFMKGFLFRHIFHFFKLNFFCLLVCLYEPESPQLVYPCHRLLVTAGSGVAFSLASLRDV